MESSCSCDIDLEPIVCGEHSIPRARKDHVCSECGAAIKKGELYHVHKGLCDGSWFTVKNCEQCEQIRKDYGCGCIGDLNTVVTECLGIGINEEP